MFAIGRSSFALTIMLLILFDRRSNCCFFAVVLMVIDSVTFKFTLIFLYFVPFYLITRLFVFPLYCVFIIINILIVFVLLLNLNGYSTMFESSGPRSPFVVVATVFLL